MADTARLRELPASAVGVVVAETLAEGNAIDLISVELQFDDPTARVEIPYKKCFAN